MTGPRSHTPVLERPADAHSVSGDLFDVVSPTAYIANNGNLDPFIEAYLNHTLGQT